MGVKVEFRIDVWVEAHRPRVSVTEVAKTPNAKSRDTDFCAKACRINGSRVERNPLLESTQRSVMCTKRFFHCADT